MEAQRTCRQCGKPIPQDAVCSACHVCQKNWEELLELTLVRLRNEYQSQGKEALFYLLQSHLCNPQDAIPYSELGTTAKMSEESVCVALKHLRKRYEKLLRDQITASSLTHGPEPPKVGFTCEECGTPIPLFRLSPLCQSCEKKKVVQGVLNRNLDLLFREFAASGHGQLFEFLRSFLFDDVTRPSYTTISAQTGVHETWVRVTLYRMRVRYRALVRQELANLGYSAEELMIDYVRDEAFRDQRRIFRPLLGHWP